MRVQDAMARTVTAVAPDSAIADAARAMRDEDAGFIPVIDDGRLVGVVTDRDIVLRCIAADDPIDPHQGEVADVMSTAAVTVAPEDDLDDAAAAMAENGVRRLAVVTNGGELVGVLSHGNLVQATGGSGAAREATLGVTEGA
jgi:CBS domain-containing protein